MADKANNVTIEVVLDDGSTKKFFAQLKTDAKNAGDEAGKAGSGIGKLLDAKNAEEFKTEIGAIATRFALVGTLAAAAGIAIIKAFDFAMAGEQLKAIETTFDRIANSQGLGGLRGQLEESSGGLVDVGSILNSTAQSLINLNGAAEQLPQLLKVATDSARLFGGTAEDRFLSLTQAVETGNTKLLKQQGIVVDADKLFSSYANSVGLLAGELTLAQKQQALMNAVLEEGAKRAAAGGEDVAPLATAYKSLSVAIGNFKDDQIKAISDGIAPFFEAIINGAASAFKKINELNAAQKASNGNTVQAAADLRVQIINTENSIKSLQSKIEALPELSVWSSPAADLLNAKMLENNLAKLQARLPELQKQFQDLGATLNAPSGPIETMKKTVQELPKMTAEQVAAIRSRNAQIEQLQMEAANQFLTTEAARLATADATAQTELEKKMLFSQQMIQLGFQQEAEIAKAQSDFTLQKGFSQEQGELARMAIIDKYNSIALQKQNEYSVQAMAKTKLFADQTKAIIQAGLVNSVVAGMESLGRSLQAGAINFQDFGAAIANVIGDMAISLGRALIVQGLGLEAFIVAINTLLPGSGIAAAALGAGLVVFGAALKASVGGGSGSGGGGFSAGTPGGTPLITTPVTDTPIEDTMPSKSDEPNTSVVVNISGDVFDSQDTGLRVVEIINEAFDKQGVVVKRGAVG